MSNFTPILAPKNARIAGGYGSGPGVNPKAIAKELFNATIPGPLLTCYMIRRFGWPNSGSDDHKNLCEWHLTTPIPGLFLAIYPYLADSGNHLHFGVRFTASVERKIEANPVRDAHFRRVRKAIRRWWDTTGSTLYSIGAAAPDELDETLVFLYHETEGRKHGIYKRIPAHGDKFKTLPKEWGMLDWWLGEFLEKHHPEVKLPEVTAEMKVKIREQTPFQKQAREALEATLTELCRTVHIRDHGFNAFGDVDRDEVAARMAQKIPGEMVAARPFVGAGYTPEYWFKNQKKIKAESKS